MGVYVKHLTGLRSHMQLITASTAPSACSGIQFCQGAILRFFAPQGRHAAPMGVAFNVEEYTKYYPIGAGVGKWGPKTENFIDF